jgi:Zinc knuckle
MKTEPPMRLSSPPTGLQRHLSLEQLGSSTPSVLNAHLVPTLGNPIPMDIDLARRRALPPALCFHCEKPGHLSKECPDRFDVQTLCIDKLQTLLEDRLAQLDVVVTEPETVPALQEPETEDFPKDNE